ncbi:MAG: hypothetical protein IKG18_03510 [Atopobiaceae bacterium]|nr:hypothetical protein [Atopobiaceae bacterium]
MSARRRIAHRDVLEGAEPEGGGAGAGGVRAEPGARARPGGGQGGVGATGRGGERDEQRGQAGHEPVERPRAYAVGLPDGLDRRAGQPGAGDRALQPHRPLPVGRHVRRDERVRRAAGRAPHALYGDLPADDAAALQVLEVAAVRGVLPEVAHGPAGGTRRHGQGGVVATAVGA